MHRPGADGGAERGVGRGGHELAHLRRLLAQGCAPAAHARELARGRLVVDVGVGDGARPARREARCPARNTARQAAQGRVGLAAGERVGPQADGRVAAGRGAVADAVAREDAGVERARIRAVLGGVGVPAPDEEPRVHRVRLRQGDRGDAQAVGERSRADGDGAAVDPGALGSRHGDRHPEDLARAGLRAHGHGHERIRHRAGEPVLDRARGLGHRDGELAQHAHGPDQLRAVRSEEPPGLRAHGAAAVDDELEGGAAAARRDERRLPGSGPRRLLQLHVGARRPDPRAGCLAARPAAGERRHGCEGGDGEGRERHAEQRALARCSSRLPAITHLLSPLGASYSVANRPLA